MGNRYMRYDAGSKFFDLPITDFNTKNLRALLESAFTGDYSGVASLYSAMEQNWDSLQKDIATKINAVATLEYKVVPYSKEGEKPTAEAEAVAKVVSDAIWRKSEQEPGVWSQNFTQMAASLYYGMLRGVHVVECYWAYEDGLVYPQYFRPVLPHFYGWETQDGKDDRLVLYPDGVVTGGGGQPFPQDKFIIALNAQTPDHPMLNAQLRCLVFPFGMYKWGGAWFMEYGNIFGKPLRKFRVGTYEDKAKLERELAAKPVLGDFVYVGDKDDVEIVSAAASGATIPQKEMMEVAERICHKVILGQTLTSDTSEHGGSLAQARVHANVQMDEVLSAGNYVCSVMNAQLVASIVRKNYGTTRGVPMPEIRCSLPGSAKNAAKVEYHKGLKDIGVPLRVDLICDEYGLPQPKDGDLVLMDGRVQFYHDPDKEEPASAPAGLQRGKPADGKPADGEEEDGPAPDDGGKPGKPDGGDGKDGVQAAKARDWMDMEPKELLDAAYKDWTAPMLDDLQAALDAGADAATIRKMISDGRLKPNTDGLARFVAAAMTEPAEGESTDKGKEA